MENNGINAAWPNNHVLGKESATTIQYEETHITKKRKLLDVMNGEESVNNMRNGSGVDEMIMQQLSVYGDQQFVTLGDSLLFDAPVVRDAFTKPKSLNCSNQDIMGNSFNNSASCSSVDSVEEIKQPVATVEKTKKKKKKSKKHRDKDKDQKKDLVELDSSSEEVREKKKLPRIGTQYQCDMAVLENGEGDRDEFLGEMVWDPSKVNLEAVNKFLQEVQLPKPLKNQFEFDPFTVYIPATTIIALDKLLARLMKLNYNFEKTKKYLMDQKLFFTDRGFAVRQQWKSSDIKIFEKGLRYIFEQDGDFDLVEVKRALPSKPMIHICEFYFAWKHSKRFQTWRDESHCPVREKRRDRGNLRATKQVDYNDQTSVVLRHLQRNAKIPRIPRADSEVIKASNEGENLVYTILIDTQIYDMEYDQKTCFENITKKNKKTDKYFLDYS